MTGRRTECFELERICRRDESQFVAVYGRRRVGKTFLVRNFFKNGFSFSHTGLQKGTFAEQLLAFRDSLVEHGYADCPPVRNWREAFECLKRLLARNDGARKTVFIDELPWMDTPGSKFVMWLGHFWNSWASARNDIVLVVCGSATSWIISKIVKDRGGLHNRLTGQIFLAPFNLAECEAYMEERGVALSRVETAEYYMAFGGVPYYWSLIEPGMSVAQNIDRLVFARNGALRGEYGQLYASLFKNAEMHLKVVDALSRKSSGMTRGEIADVCGLSSGGTFATVLEELEQCGFIRSFREPGRRTKGTQYQLMDNFTLFHQRFMVEKGITDEHFWENSLNTPAVNTWRGLAFERVCLQHVSQIKRALGISGVLTNEYSWRHIADDIHPAGVQIDLLLDRADNLVNICEMKWSSKPFAIDKEYDAKLRLKAGTFSDVTQTRKGVNTTLVASSGVVDNMYRHSVQSVVTLDDLFEEERG